MLDHAQRLAATALGQQLGSQDCTALASLMSTKEVQTGEALFRHGDPGDALFVVLQGQLKIALEDDSAGELVVALLGPGGVVGELEVVTDTARMATAIATEPTTLLQLDACKLKDRPTEHAAVLGRLVDTIARVLGLRLAAVNAKLLAAWGAQSTDANLGDPHPTGNVRQLLDDVWQW